MGFKLKGGVLIIGSLYWQDWRDEEGDDIRKNWRDSHLDMSEVKNVPAPIRYGRFSGKYDDAKKRGTRTYTMVFDNRLDRSTEYGQAKAIPFSNEPFISFREIKAEVKGLSEVEGRRCRSFIKGSTSNSPAWCVCAVVFNPNVSASIKESLLKQWDEELRKNPVGYAAFSSAPDLYSMKLSGELDIPWPAECANLDFLVATSTRPLHRDSSTDWPSVREIIEWANKEREYFGPNIELGIKTFQDEEVRQSL